MGSVNAVHPAPEIHEHFVIQIQAHFHPHWDHCDQLRERHDSHRRDDRAALSTLRAVCRCVIWSAHIVTLAQVLRSVFPFHPWSKSCALVIERFLPSVLLPPAEVPFPPFLDSCHGVWWRLRMTHCATPPSGAWSHLAMSHPTQVMSPKTWSSQTPMSSTSRPPSISTSSTPWTTRLLSPTIPDVDDDEFAEFLAVVVDRTGQPAVVRSNSDQFFWTSETWKVLRVSFL